MQYCLNSVIPQPIRDGLTEEVQKLFGLDWVRRVVTSLVNRHEKHLEIPELVARELRFLQLVRFGEEISRIVIGCVRHRTKEVLNFAHVPRDFDLPIWIRSQRTLNPISGERFDELPKIGCAGTVRWIAGRITRGIGRDGVGRFTGGQNGQKDDRQYFSHGDMLISCEQQNNQP